MLHLQIKFGCNLTSNFSKKIIPILHFPPNLTSDDPWPWYMTFDLINIQRNSHCIFDPSLVVPIRLQLFKGDPNNQNLTEVEHTGGYYTHTNTIHIRYTDRFARSQYPSNSIAFQARGLKILNGIKIFWGLKKGQKQRGCCLNAHTAKTNQKTTHTLKHYVKFKKISDRLDGRKNSEQRRKGL